MNPSHTPGPWYVVLNGQQIEVHSHDNTNAREWTIARNLREYDARLIAASPDLLAALKRVLAILQQPATVALDNQIVAGDLALARDTVTRALSLAEGQP